MKKIIVLLLASSLAGCSGPGPGGGSGSVPADYYATYEGANLACCIVRDVFHKPPQPLLKGQAKVGETAVWGAKDNALQMVLTAPPPEKVPVNATGEPLVTPSMGIFSIGHNYGPGTRFTISATFQRPVPPPSGKAWSVTVVGRTGDVDDASGLMRIQLSFRIKGGQAQARVQEVHSADPDDPASQKLASVDITTDDYNAIFNSGRPFTLRLSLDRKAGSGTATITVGDHAYPPLNFTPTIFTASTGDPLTTVGAALADGFALGETVSVEVTDFKIWGRDPPPRRPATTPPLRKPIPRADPSH